MFEGLIHRVVVGYLGRYVKDFHKDQLKLSLWNEEVFLENVDLIPEAFDYLQLPFSIKQGRVGKLSIKISWKKLGWDHPIIIVLEDVFVRVSQRDDKEWDLDAVERREFAAKKAQLAAAELSKLSRRVSDNQTGKSFISYITAKVLDSIQVSIRNFHVQYSGTQFDTAQVLLGLKFSGLTIKQNLVGSLGGKVVGGQVNKTVDIEGLEIYCNTSEIAIDSVSLDDETNCKFGFGSGFEGSQFEHMLQPVNVSLSLMVNRAGKLDTNMPQCSISAELPDLAMSLNEVQLQQMLMLLDYLNISRLREKYGRYRPWHCPLSRKQDGWQKLWWHYAQEAILSDVRRKLKKTSWKHFGLRLSFRRKYINLYETKLVSLHKEQSIDEHILHQLEEMEKESDIDDILSYRSAAECKLQEVMLNSSSSIGVTGSNVTGEKLVNEERSSGRSGGWLNWLSRGMLGAGGTDDSSQFSGVISDDVVKDIYEATKFHPSVESNGDADSNVKMLTCAMKFSIGRISAILQKKCSGQKIADLTFKGVDIECKLWEELATVICLINSGEMLYPSENKVILHIGMFLAENNVRENEFYTCSVQVDVSTKQDVELSIEVALQPVELTCDIQFMLNLVEFFDVLKSFKFQHERVLLSLDGIEDVHTRMLSKSEYILSSHKRLSWELCITNMIIYVPWREAISEPSSLVFELGSLVYTSKCDMDSIASSIGGRSYILKQFSSSSSTNTFSTGGKVQDIYNLSGIKLKDFELKLMTPQHALPVPMLEKCCGSITLVSSVISDESVLKQLEVFVNLPSLAANFSPSIYLSVMSLVAYLGNHLSKSKALISGSPRHNITQNQCTSAFGFSVSASLDLVSLHIHLTNAGETNSELVFSVQEIDIGYSHLAFDECRVCAKSLKISTSSLSSERDCCILCLSRNYSSSSPTHNQELGARISCHSKNPDNARRCTEPCFLLHYESRGQVDAASHSYTVGLSDTDLHCHPHVVGALIGFYKTLSEYGSSLSSDSSFFPVIDAKKTNQMPEFKFQRFGYSNFSETWPSDANISLDSYPFITVPKSSSPGGVDTSLNHCVPGWRKNFRLKDVKSKSPKFPIQRASKTWTFLPGRDARSASGTLCDANVINVDFNLCGVEVHFHDSSSIIGTISLPITKSALLIYEDSMDLLCSIEDLSLASLWWNKGFKEFLWGPSLANLSPILNLRVRKGNSQLEISAGIQHVCCILPSEYLAIIIGYFSLPDWNSNPCDQSSNQHTYAENKGQIVYKFEIVDSVLILPIEKHENQFLKIELPELYLSFMTGCAQDDIVKDVPLELVPAGLVASAYRCLNIFGRDLCLSFLLRVKDEKGCLMLDWNTGYDNISLISPLCANIWIRIPCDSDCSNENSSVFTCVMSKINRCQLIADDCHSLHGFEKLLVAIDQLCSVGEDSRHFTSDVCHFLQWKSVKENGTVLPISSDRVFTKVRCSVDSLVLLLSHPKKCSTSSEPVVKADMQFLCSASLIDDALIDLDISFYCLALHSVPDSLLLAQCVDNCSASSVLRICFSVEGENKLDVLLPSLNIWLYISNWMEIFNLYNSYSIRTAESVVVEASPGNSLDDVDVRIEKVAPPVAQSSHQNAVTPTNCVPDNRKQNALPLIVKSDDIGLTIHFPIKVVKAATVETGVSESQEERPLHTVEREMSKFIVISTHSDSSELSMIGGNMTMKAILEKITGTVGMCRNESITTRPFFQLSKVNMSAEILNNQMDPAHANVEVQCDRLDAQLSYHSLCFWQDVSLDIPESESSDSSFTEMDIRMQLRKTSFLISDERWSCGGPLLEIIMRKFLVHSIVTENCVESSITSDLEANYNNVHKVLWEPFVEPWKFQINMIRKHEITTLLSSSITTDIHLLSTTQLNFNCTESFIECIFRIMEMVKDAWHMMEANGSQNHRTSLLVQFSENPCEESYAPYVLQNLTSLPLVYSVSEGLASGEVSDFSKTKDRKSVQPGASVPICLHETPDEQLFRHRPSLSSDKLNEKQSNGVFHHFMSIQLDGMPMPSSPISMDLVGITYFEVDFSKASKKSTIVDKSDVPNYHMNAEEDGRHNAGSGFVVPVVFDVSMQHYSKLIRLYSTVILYNATSMPLELRFDIPFGVSPKILDPIYPDQEFPLPLHLAEAGRIRWRPSGNSYLWSEAHDISIILSQESKIGFLRSFVCYPSHPSSDPFRCSISVQNFCLPSSTMPRKGSSPHIIKSLKQSLEHGSYDHEKSKKRFVRQLTLSTPFVVYNYLPEEVVLTMESGGIVNTVLLTEVETRFHHVDPSHGLGLEFSVTGFRPSTLKFPRAETFSTMAKFSGRKFSLTEIISFNPDLSNGPIYVTVEKVMDAFSGARELFISVPFLLYNCTGIPLNISEAATEMKGSHCSIPSCYDLDEDELLDGKKDGLGLLSSYQSLYARASGSDSPRHSFSKEHIVLGQPDHAAHFGRIVRKPLVLAKSSKTFHRQSDKHASVDQASFNCSSGESILKDSDLTESKNREVKACMYCPYALSSATDPHSISSSTEIMVRVRRCVPEYPMESMPIFSWSGSFPLVPPSGSSTVLVPRSSPSDAYIISATSSALAGPFAGRTQVITFQPRYVISNACSKRLCYKQQGTDFFRQLDIGQSSHLHWRDTMRELLVSIRFDEPGWEWSGSFLPDHLGDTQVKMRNDVLGALNMVRVEVQNADVSPTEEKIVGSLHGNSGTNLILLSDDDTGFMPYRIDNFSKERLRVYQQQCEKFDTIVHPYSSCPYAWDEPCSPHRLTVEVPGERVIGSYALDDMKDHMPVHLKSTPEKPERTLLLSVRTEGSTKVLVIVDSSYHVLEVTKKPSPSLFREKNKQDQKPKNYISYKEKISVAIPYISISLIDSYPQELLFACAKTIRVDLLQNLDQLKLSFQIASLQVDNQLHRTPYPVVLSFNQECRNNTFILRENDDVANSTRDTGLQITAESSCEPVLYLALATWRKKDISLVSFEYISLRLTSFRLELDQEFVLSMLDFTKAVSSRFNSKFLPFSDLSTYPLVSRDNQPHGIDHLVFTKSQTRNVLLPSVIPIGAPWQQIYLLARRQKKIYVELFDVAPIKFTLSFSSAPWILGNGLLTSGESLIHRGLMALADVEGAQIHLKHLKISHQMASWESMQDILIRHYTRQLLHEIYKVFGSAGVIGNPLGFARTLGLGIRDFLSVPARSVLQSPTGLITGVAQGTTSLVSNTVYALSDAATQFSRAAHKGIVAFTFDDQSVAKMEKQQKGVASHSKGVIGEVLEGLTGLLQSPIKQAEKHGLPGVLSGIALGVTGLVAKPAASILEVTGKTAQSIRNRSKLYQVGSQRRRVRLPRPLSRELPLRPYSLEEAVGAAVLFGSDDGLKFKDEVLVMCKSIKQAGKFVVLTERLVLMVSCPSLVDVGKPDFWGVPVEPEWIVEVEIGLDSVFHADTGEGVVHIVGSSSDAKVMQSQHQSKKGGAAAMRTKCWNNPTSLPFFQTDLDLASKEDAEEFLCVLLSTIEQGKERGWGSGYILHQSSIR